MADESDARLDELRRVLNLAHDEREKGNQPLLARLILRFQPAKKQPTNIRKPKDAA
jgi:hypothetical protein